jgi:hypothetical protein
MIERLRIESMLAASCRCATAGMVSIVNPAIVNPGFNHQ